MSALAPSARLPLAVGGLVLAALLGGWHGVSQARRDAEVRRAAPAAAPAHPQGDERDPAGPAAPPRPSPEAVRAAEQALLQAKAELDAGRFAEGQARYSKAIEVFDSPDDPSYGLARRGAALARLLSGLARELPESAFVGREDLVEVELFGRRRFVVRVLTDAADTVELELSSGARLRFAPSDLTGRQPISQESWQARVVDDLQDRARELDPQNPFQLFRIAWFCYEHGLRDDGRSYLVSAVERDRAGLLAQTFCPAPERPTAEERALLYGDGRPARGGLASAGAASGGPSGAGVGAQGYQGAVAVMQQAIAVYAQSYRLEGEAARQALERAEQGFRDARARFEEVVAAAPDQTEAMERLREVQQFLADCSKASRLAH